MDAKVSGARTACGYITTDSYLRAFRAGVSNETVLPSFTKRCDSFRYSFSNALVLIWFRFPPLSYFRSM